MLGGVRRLHLFELHDQPWYPAAWRRLVQEILARGLVLFGLYEHATPVLKRFLERVSPAAVLDLCSGAADPTLKLFERAGVAPSTGKPPLVVLSDLYPPLGRYAALKGELPGRVDFCAEAVDALKVPDGLPPVRTIVSSLHHFRPAQVRRILRDAALRTDGLAVFEATRRSPGHLMAGLAIPWIALALCLFALRPFRWRNLAWGVLIPVVPLTLLWDGLVSMLRTYTVDELHEIADSLEVAGFHWEAGTFPLKRLPLKGVYLLGWRRSTR